MDQFKSFWLNYPDLTSISLHILVTLAILIIGWWVSNLCGDLVKRFFKKTTHVDRTLLPIFVVVVVWMVRVVVLLAVLARLGIQTASLVAMLGASALAIGLALQGTLQNIAAGIMLLVLRPIRVGEYISVEGKGSGTVDEIGIFLTRIIKDDGVHLLLPNSLVWGNPLVNYSRNQIRRMDLQLGVRYDEDIKLAITALEKLVNDNENVLKDPAPRVMVNAYKENSVVVNVWAWIAVSNYWNTRYEIYQQAPEALAKAGLSTPVRLQEIRTLPADTPAIK